MSDKESATLIDKKNATLMELYKLSMDTRKLELNLFWQRSLFFWGFIAATFIAYAELLKQHSPLLILIAGFGVISSLVWYLANRGSKWWHENWETKVERLENELGFDLFSTVETPKPKRPKMLSSLNYSVSKLTIGLSLFMFFIWVLMLMYSVVVQIFKKCDPNKDIALIILGILFGVVFIFSVILILRARISPRENSKTENG